MPSTYAHYKFGDQCREALPPKIRGAVEQRREIYDIGVHGPDIFFYYYPFGPNAVIKYGSGLHGTPARGFFENAKEVYHQYGNKREMISYLFGFLSHFVLDSTCHGYVESERKKLKITHDKLESMFDSYLMKKDSLIPTKVNRGFSLKPDLKAARVISRFYDYDADVILAACKGQVSVMNLLYSPSGRKKAVARNFISRFPMPLHLGDLFVDDDIPEEYMASILQLEELFDQARADYGKIARNFLMYLKGEEILSPRFDRDFK